MRSHLAAVALAFVLGACGGGGGAAPCAATDSACALRAIHSHRAKNASTWKEAFARPLEERIGPAPPFLVEFIALDNIAHQYPNRPRQATPDPAFVDDVRKAIAGMPESVRLKIAPRLAGIYLLEDLGSSGFADQVRDGARPVGGFIVLDPSVLRGHTANSWTTWRDGTPFKSDPDWRLEGVLAEAGADDRLGAMQYILLHEFAHVLSIGEAFHPDWEVAPRDVKSAEPFPYFALSWQAGGPGPQYASRFDAAFPRRKDVVYYFGARIPGDEMAATYEALERTNFPTLYGATHPADDFAEAFANYVHTQMLGKPFEVRLLRKGRAEKVYRACWEEPRCAEKRALLERYLAKR